ncbi:MAG: gliding motility-associated C-terminal domain-containing protein [Bacteroidales bacterium]|nr:gliding motility-associated C-terminal domain-containing protein [Bacteroidales bacterium]
MYWLDNGFVSGDTVYTNSGWFYDDGGNDVYQEDQNWSVTFCSENGSPLTIDFSDFRTHFGGILGEDSYTDYDYITVDYPGASYVVYHDNTPAFSFTSQGTCITVGFISDADGQVDSGWVAEILALPAPFNNDPADAEELVVGNICSPSFYSNKGAFNTTSLGSPPCQTYFGGDVWFRAEVPASGVLKLETFTGSLDYAILDIFKSPDANLLPSERIACVDDAGAMPSVILAAPDIAPGDVVYIRLFGEQAKSGLFGICASDPAAPVTGFSGPGGVGDSVSLDYWFKPESGVYNATGSIASENEPVRSWEDQSGNAQHLVQDNSISRPLYVAVAAGRFGALQFDGGDDFFELESGSGDAPLHWFATGSFQGSQRQTMVSIGDAFPAKTASLSRDTDGRYFSFTGGDLSGPPLAEGVTHIFNVAHTNTVSLHRLELNGQPQLVDQEPLPLETDGTFRMGASWEGTEPFAGQISELIQYRKSLNRAQEIIVNNYLSAKYNIPLAENDFYPYKATFPYDVAGIGRIDADNTHTKAMSAGLLSVSGADDFDDNEFLLFGHDNGDAISWSSSGGPAGDTNIVRMERMWRIALTGSPGEVTLGLQQDALPALPGGYVAYNILVDTDGDFSSGAEAYGPYELNNELVINNLSISHGDYVTIAAVRPVISFVSDATASLETVANPVMEVVLNYAVSTPVEVSYTVTGGTAIQGEDFSLVSSVIIIDPGNHSGNIIPLVLDDDVPEIPDEYFDVQISSSTPGVVAGGIPTSRHTILNDDLEVGILASDTVVGACNASQAVLVADARGTGPFTYAWIPSGGLNTTVNDTVIAGPDATTYYSVEVTDRYGLTKQAGVTVHVVPAPAKPEVSAGGPTTFCQGNTVAMAAPEGFTSYLWSTGENTRKITVHEAGNYNVVVTDSFGCDSPVSADITVTVNPLPDPPEIAADGPLEFCEGESVTLTAGGDFVSYTWNDGVTGKERMVDASGVYSVFVKDANGCVGGYSDSVDVTELALPAQPVITPPGPQVLFMGETIRLTSSQATAYLWSPGGDTIRSVDVSSAGDYAVIVENESGCQSIASATVTVTVSKFLPPPEITVNGVLAFCLGDSVALTGPEGFSAYTWSDGATGREKTVTTEGSFTLVVTNAHGTKSLPSEAVLITVYALPELSVRERITPLCYNDGNGSIIVTSEEGTAPYSYHWMDRDETSATISSLTAGTYGVLVEDSHGCMDTLEIGLSEPGPLEVDYEVQDAYCPDFSDGSVELTAITGGTSPYMVAWTGGGTTEYLQDLSPGTYDYTVTDANGCALDGTAAVGFQNDACFTVPGIITPNQDGSNDYWRIEGLEVYPEVTLEIFDRWGRRVFYSEGHAACFDGTYNGKELPMESYHYVIDLHNGSERIIGNITIIR